MIGTVLTRTRGTVNLGTVLSVTVITVIVLTVTTGALLLKELLRILFCQQNLDLDTRTLGLYKKPFFQT